jgi:2-hydroxy-3-oxopropionate reductase
MGEPMARNLLAAGYGVRAWNRSKEKTSALAEKGTNSLDHSALIREIRRANALSVSRKDG